MVPQTRLIKAGLQVSGSQPGPRPPSLTLPTHPN